jgi:hypothetical protein
MRETDSDLELRTATMDDAEIVANLEAARNPEDPRYRLVDPVVELHRELNS